MLLVVNRLNGKVDIPRITSFLNIAPNTVEAIIRGPAKALFIEDSSGNTEQSGLWLNLWRFLLNEDRAGPFFLSKDTRDAPFIQFLSRFGPSQSCSRKDLIDVLVLFGRGHGPQDPSHREKHGYGSSFAAACDSDALVPIMYGPAGALFEEGFRGDIRWSGLGYHVWDLLMYEAQLKSERSCVT